MKKKILIGFLNREMKGAIPTITRAFIEGLRDKYDFMPFFMDRRHRKGKAEFNAINFYYLLKHHLSWIIAIIRNRPDIVHFPVTSYWNMEKSILFLLTARIMGVKKVVGHLHGGAFEHFWNSCSPLRRKIAHSVLSRLDAFIVLSKHWEVVATSALKINRNKVFEVNNPIERELENSFRNFTRKYSSEKILITSISNLNKSKGILSSIRALGKLQEDYRYDIVGKETEKGFEERLARDINEGGLGNKVKIAGEKYGIDKIILLKEADIYLLPSHIENFPLAVIEAACAAIPIITTPVGALPEFFTHMENIYYVEPGNVEEIRDAVEFMIHNRGERERLGKAARQVFLRKLAREKIMEQLDRVYTRIYS